MEAYDGGFVGGDLGGVEDFELLAVDGYEDGITILDDVELVANSVGLEEGNGRVVQVPGLVGVHDEGCVVWVEML